METKRNDDDFNVYFNKTISTNAYTDRLLAYVKRRLGHSFESQTIRSCVYEVYHRLKQEEEEENKQR